MNVQFQICGLCILFLMLTFYQSHKNLHLYKEKMFFAVLCMMTVSLIFDVLSLVAIKYTPVLPPHFVPLVCKLYIITLVWVVWSALMYVVSDVTTHKRHKTIIFRTAILTAIESVIVLCVPINIFNDGSRMYTYGPSVLCVYAFVAAYIAATLIVVFIFRKTLNPRRKFAIVIWMLIWILSAALQFFNDGLLLVGFAGTLGVLILFMVMENPEGNIERQLGCFNSYALTEYLKQLYEDGEPFAALEISFENGKGMEERVVDINTAIRKLLPLCEKQVLAFKDISRGLVLICPSEQTMRKTQNTIAGALGTGEITQSGVLYTLVPQADALANAEELLRFFAFVKTERQEEMGTLIEADGDTVSRYQNRFLMEREIELALEQDRVEVFLQPIYSNSEKCFVSAEALVRIRREDGTLLSPGLFIPVAEGNGQILKLGDRVFEKVCCLLKNTDILRLGIRYVEINLSVVQCETENLAQHLIAIAEQYQVDPKYINLEITETASISARRILLENMKKLIACGFTFSLDDFGKGESNLMYVVEMPVSLIKLDSDMSQAFFHTPKAKQVVRAVVGMARDMGLKVVAEGIETREELEQITREKVDYIQGYCYAKPLPVDEFLTFIQQENRK